MHYTLLLPRVVGSTLLAAMLIAGCGGSKEGSDGPPSRSASASDAATPQGAAEAYRRAMAEGDWLAGYAHLTDAAGAGLLKALLMSGMMSASDRARAEEFMSRVVTHNLPKNDAELMAVGNLAEVYADLAGWIEAHDPGSRAAESLEQMRDRFDAAEYTEFEIAGDGARAQFVVPEGSKRVEFRRVEGRWLLETAQ